MQKQNKQIKILCVEIQSLFHGHYALLSPLLLPRPDYWWVRQIFNREKNRQIVRQTNRNRQTRFYPTLAFRLSHIYSLLVGPTVLRVSIEQRMSHIKTDHYSSTYMWNHRMSMCDIFFNIVKLTALQTVDNTGKTCRLYAHCARWIFMSKSKNPVRKPFPIFWRRRSKGVVVFALNMGHSDSYIWLGDEVKFCCWWCWFFKGYSMPVLVSLMLMLYAHWSGKSGRVPAITSGGKPAGKNQDLNLSWVGLSGDECAAQWEASGAGWGSASWGENFQLFSNVRNHSKLGKCVENWVTSIYILLYTLSPYT